MKKHLHELVEQYDIPKSWLAELTGFNRRQVSNWVMQPDKTPIPADKKAFVQDKLRELGKVLINIELK